jgi:sigma-E factor negative regulatory protein RseB
MSSMSVLVIALAYIVGAPEVSQARQVVPPVNEIAADFTDANGVSPLNDPPVDTFTSSTASPGTSPIAFSTNRPSSRTGSSAGGDACCSTGSESRAVSLLRRAVAAPDRIAFRGVRVCRSYLNGHVESFTVAIRHSPRQGTTFSVLSSDAGSDPTLFIGSGGGASEASIDKAITRLASSYDVDVDGVESVLGRPAMVVSASADGQVRAKFWIDKRTGLLLKREMYAGGQLVRSSGYTSFSTARHGFMLHLPPELPTPPIRMLSTQIAAALTDKGWTYPARLGGSFRLSQLRQLGGTGAVTGADYTDGLSTLSVFEERGSLDVSSLVGFRRADVGDRTYYVREGLPMMVVWQSGDTVFTVVTDLPEPMTAALVSRFPSEGADQDDAGRSVTDRVGNGLSRLVAAVKP